MIVASRGMSGAWGDFWRDALGNLIDTGTSVLADRNGVPAPAPIQTAPPPEVVIERPAPTATPVLPILIIAGLAVGAYFLLQE